MGVFRFADRWRDSLRALSSMAYQPQDGAQFDRLMALLEQRDVQLEQALVAIEDTGWSEPTLLNSWVNNGAERTARVRRLGDQVYVEGLVKDGTLSATVLVLDKGFRPPMDMYFGSQAGLTFGMIAVLATGALAFYGSTNVAASINCSFSVTP